MKTLFNQGKRIPFMEVFKFTVQQAAQKIWIQALFDEAAVTKAG